jgi:hypothetical protein
MTMTSLRILSIAALSLVSTAALASNPADYNVRGVPTASNFTQSVTQLSSTAALSDQGNGVTAQPSSIPHGGAR